MRLKRYGIVLESLTADHLEMVRLWRNQDYIRERMQFQKRLTRVDQERWFKQLDPSTNIYWVIRYNDYPIGLIHIKDIDHQLLEGEAGIFIGEPSFLEMPQPMLAIIFMMELAFYAFGLKELKAKIHSDNVKAQRFNLELGYRLHSDQPTGFQYYTVDGSEFESATRSIRTSSAKMYGGRSQFVLNDDSDVWHLKLKMLNAEANQYFNPD